MHKSANWENLYINRKLRRVAASLAQTRFELIPAPLPPVILKEFSLRKVEAAGGQDTAAFSAELWWRGKRIARICNAGTGGDTDVRFCAGGCDVSALTALLGGLPFESSYSLYYQDSARLGTFDKAALFFLQPARISIQRLADLAWEWHRQRKWMSDAKLAMVEDKCGAFRVVRFKHPLTANAIAAATAPKQGKFKRVIGMSALMPPRIHYYPSWHTFDQGDAVVYAGEPGVVESGSTDDVVVVQLSSPGGKTLNLDPDLLHHATRP